LFENVRGRSGGFGLLGRRVEEGRVDIFRVVVFEDGGFVGAFVWGDGGVLDGAGRVLDDAGGFAGE
jgi:hypothetical protein